MEKSNSEKMENEQKIVVKWPLVLSISLFLFIIVFALVINDLMRIEVLPRDWLVFHDFLNRTGSVKVFSYVAVLLMLVVPTVLPARLNLITVKSAYLIAFWFLLSNAIDALGNVFGWFAVGKPYSIPWYDDLAHFLGGFIYASIAWIVWCNAVEKTGIKVPLRFVVSLAVLTACFLGTIYGIHEYYSDMFFGTYMTGGVEDVITDNVFDILGAVVAGIALLLHHFKGKGVKLFQSSPYRYLTQIYW